MTNQEIEQKVRELLAKKFDIAPDKISLESRLAEDLGVDSFGAVEMMFEIEEAFGLKIPDSEIEHVRKVNDIVVYLRDWLDKHGKG
jgi:acyl carrier protein